MNAATHIASVVVWAVPGCRAALADRLAKLPALEHHGEPGVDKFAVVIEADSDGGVADTIEAIAEWPEVVNVQLVYQHTETTEALEEEI